MTVEATAAIIAAVLVFIPTMIGAVASLRNGRAMRTNDGRRPGEYIETTNAAVLDHGIQLERFRRDLAETTTIVKEHVATDLEAFEELRAALGIKGQIVQTLKAQDRAAEVVRITLDEAAARIKSDLDAREAKE